MDIVILVICGSIIGVVSSFFGIGGGSLIVPILYSLFPTLSHEVVISTSLGSIFLVSTLNSYKFYKLNILPSKNEILFLLIFNTIGGLAGSQLTFYLDAGISKMILGVILLFIGLKPFILKKKSTQPTNQKVLKSKLSITALFGSLLSSVTGLGGGALFVPLLIHYVRVPLKQVSSYSNVSMVFATLTGLFPHLLQNYEPNLESHLGSFQHLFLGNLNYGIMIVISLSSLLTSKSAIKFNQKVSDSSKQIMFSILMILISCKILFY